MKECEFKKECEKVFPYPCHESHPDKFPECRHRKFAILVQEKTVKDTLEMMESFRIKPLLQEQPP